VRFLVDEKLPRALARWIADQGHEAHHAFDLAMSSAFDVEIARQAADTDAVIVSKDEDFVTLSRRNEGLIWLRFGNRPRAMMPARFAQAWPAILERLQSDERLVEVR
jgi:predicted nuclease of predicted toxin-antitoxin system